MLRRTDEPERDPAPREPVFNVPGPVAAVLGALVAVHAARQAIPDAWDDALFVRLALVPGRLTAAVAPGRVRDALVALAGRGEEGYRQAAVGRWFLDNTGFQPWTAATYALLHADWAHVGLNAVWLLAFGTPVARRLRAGRFLALLLVAALAGALAQWGARPLDFAPVIGASAAVSGCMGATLRFMFQPRVSMAAVVGAVGEGRRRIFLQPARTLRELLADSRAAAFLAAWLATNLLFGLGPVPLALGGGPIAWQAHLGGFLAGLLLFRFFDPVRAAAAADPAPPGPAPDASPDDP